uniref:Uncharacterized protein n=1 Tax=Bosea sp. NBC_00436 TaxID=2969620 RepID=A0A9E7ZK67_9HYPH
MGTAAGFRDVEPLHELIDPPLDRLGEPLTFKACINAHGMYETMRFVLRLSPKNHEIMNSIEFGIRDFNDLTNEQIQCYSTYLHETVHWWQHVGSTSGLVLSLSYLAQTHSSLGELKNVLSQFGPKKSLKRFADEMLMNEGESAQSKLKSANISVNNALDVEYYKAFAMSPVSTAKWLGEQVHFECVGHGYSVAYGQLVGMIAKSVDPDFAVLPGGSHWDDNFLRLRNQKALGFYWGSPIRVPPLGIHAVYEGQARFIQLQFLNATRLNSPSVDDWRQWGYFEGIYVEAFDTFLNLTESAWPDTISDPIVSLFLLVCDLSINPSRGFPLEIEKFENFIDDVDVGIRFFKLSDAVRRNPDLKNSIKNHSREEYVNLSEKLAEAAKIDSPIKALETVLGWGEQIPGLKGLMEEHSKFEYNAENLPIRVLFSHFIAFARDKFRRPEFFCWPAAWLVGNPVGADVAALWLRHLSLFTDRGDKPGVYPRIWPDRDPAAVQETFETFYQSMALYNLTRQWILFDGPFKCNFEWLAEKYSQEQADSWASSVFKQVFGVDITDFSCY